MALLINGRTLRIENSDCKKYIDFSMIKLSNEGDNVSVECETNVKLNNGKTKYSWIVNKSSKEFAFECKNFLPLKEIFETEPKNLSEKNTLIFDIMVSDVIAVRKKLHSFVLIIYLAYSSPAKA